MSMARIWILKCCANLILFLKNLIFSEAFKERHRTSSRFFTRNRALPFPTLLLFLLNQLKGSIQDELDQFFKSVFKLDIAKRIVTKSAFCQARMKIRFHAFVELNRKLVGFFYANFRYETWNGLRLLGIDGTSLNLPDSEDVIAEFGEHKSLHHEDKPMGRLSQAFDPINRITVETVLTSCKTGERDHFLTLLKAVEERDLLLLDRGYPAFWVFALLTSRSVNYCAKIPRSWSIVKKFLNSGKRESVVNLSASPAARKKCKSLGIPAETLRFRLIRIDIPGEKACALATSLTNAAIYSAEIFSDLYHHRWPVEEDYKTLKSRLEIENFSGKSAQAVYQDAFAKIFTKNLTRCLAFETGKQVKKQSESKKFEYSINFTQALSKMKDVLPLLFLRDIPQKLIKALREIFMASVEPVRPDRHFERPNKIRRKYYFCYPPVR